ncbi:hypothetical protein KM800_11605 [Clostridium tyrobutyricum]|uniref:hypothetical protein n=1 Tax=Clostridium tyrobutyricum TaxID=1519 RepID=UPI001C382DD8|nr:hypothetical protein [Clostridium tyrobutyricum]MBV4419960.1 hypothetical protein [Clostridium tyrobutyricum]
MRRRAFKSVTIFCIILVALGIIIVNNSMPKFIKDKSDFSIDCNLNPFNFTINTKNYSIDFGRWNLYNFKNISFQFTENVCKGVKDKTDDVVDGMDKTFRQIKSNIVH